jgi:methionyl aminopeptidase
LALISAAAFLAAAVGPDDADAVAVAAQSSLFPLFIRNSHFRLLQMVAGFISQARPVLKRFDSRSHIPIHLVSRNRTRTGGHKGNQIVKKKGASGKISRNAPCPCGSGKKYKRCCLNKPAAARPADLQYAQKHRIQMKTPEQIEGIRRAGRLVIETLNRAAAIIEPGTTTEEINTLVHDFTIRNNAVPAPLNYRGFPKSVCVSINDVICHGIPGKRVLADGDIVNVDVTSILDGFYADASKTFFVGTPGADARKIVDVTRNCLARAMAVVKPGKTVGDIGYAIQSYAEGQGCSVVREFVGHGVGLDFHEAPQIPHYGWPGTGVRLMPGMVFTIEPMINLGEKELKVLDDGWTAVTKDGSLSAQFEQTLLVTESGHESLTPYPL